MLQEMLQQISPLDSAAMETARQHWDAIAKPLHSLGRLEDLVVQLAGITGTANLPPRKKGSPDLLYRQRCCGRGRDADHTGSHCRRYPQFYHGHRFSQRPVPCLRGRCFSVDIGVAEELHCDGIISRKIAAGTRNFAHEPAMTREQAERAILTGIALVGEKVAAGYNLIITGEMGIGNTTTSSAVFSVLQQLPPEQVTGRGAGLSGAGLRHKVEVIAKAIALHQPDRNDVLDVLSKVGGLDICGMAGAFLGGAVYHVPVLIDGFISAVAANCAVRLVPLCRQYLFASHCSREPAGKLALEALGLRAYLDCDMCLGEGTGGVIGAKLFDFALAAYGEIAGFDAVGIAPYEKNYNRQYRTKSV